MIPIRTVKTIELALGPTTSPWFGHAYQRPRRHVKDAIDSLVAISIPSHQFGLPVPIVYHRKPILIQDSRQQHRRPTLERLHQRSPRPEAALS
jgi:hypothetical protein